MSSSQLTVFGTQGQRMAQLPAEVPENPEPSLLARLYKKAIKGKDCRYAVVRSKGRVRALYLAEDLVPEKAIRMGANTRHEGNWATTALRLGEWGGGRAFMGPHLFFRQVDITPREAWLAPVLVGFGRPDPSGRALVEGPESRQLLEFQHRGSRFFYAYTGSRWTLYGAGNTPEDRIEAVRAASGDDIDAFLWGVGAIPLRRP